MLVAAFGDIHGNLPALEAVLRAIDAEGIMTVVCPGDLVAGYPWPNEVVATMRARKIPTVQGVFDRLTLRAHRKAETQRKRLPEALFERVQWTHAHLRSEHIEYLRSLPKSCSLMVDTIAIGLCHGTYTSQSDALHVNDSDARFMRQREAANTRIVIAGRTHAPFHRWVAETLFVNPGSVGIASERRGQAAYAVIETDAEPWTVHHRTAAYDTSALESALEENGLTDPTDFDWEAD